MKETVQVAQAATAMEGLPARVQDALGELAGAAKQGLLALSVGVGLGVLSELMAEEVDDVVGPKGRHNRDRTAVRHGHEGGEVTLGGRRAAVERPRVRTVDGESEVPLETYRHFADRDPLGRLVLEQARRLTARDPRPARQALAPPRSRREPVRDRVRAATAQMSRLRRATGAGAVGQAGRPPHA